MNRHPITVRMYGIGVPAWVGLAAGGPFGCALIGLVAALIVLVGWE